MAVAGEILCAGIPGLVLAADYTRQPFLATMEGAVLSGQQAANLARP